MDNYEKLNELHEAMISLDNLYCLWSKKYGITKNELCILSILLSKEGLTQKQIYSKTGITFSTLNSAIKNLAKQNYLIFKIDSSNKKEKHLFLTEEGRSYAKKIVDPLMAIEKNTAKEINGKDIDAALSCLRTYRRLLNERFEKEGL